MTYMDWIMCCMGAIQYYFILFFYKSEGGKNQLQVVHTRTVELSFFGQKDMKEIQWTSVNRPLYAMILALVLYENKWFGAFCLSTWCQLVTVYQLSSTVDP